MPHGQAAGRVTQSRAPPPPPHLAPTVKRVFHTIGRHWLRIALIVKIVDVLSIGALSLVVLTQSGRKSRGATLHVPPRVTHPLGDQTHRLPGVEIRRIASIRSR